MVILRDGKEMERNSLKEGGVKKVRNLSNYAIEKEGKNMDNYSNIRYNDDRQQIVNNSSVTESSFDDWKNRNRELIKYAGDSALESMEKGFADAVTFMKDAGETANPKDVENTAVKWQLARDADNEELYKAARSEMIGHLSDENKEEYLKVAVPLSDYIEAKDTYDYNNGNYTTTKNLNAQPNESVRQVQGWLNSMGYTDKFGNALKEDGIAGAKTLYAMDKSNDVVGLYDKFKKHIEKPLKRIEKFFEDKPGTTYKNYEGNLSENDKDLNKTKQTMIKCLSSNWYANKGNADKQNKIHKQAEKLREFDDQNFSKAYLLNSSNAAGSGSFAAGHSAIMLMNKSGEALVFSFFPTEDNPIKAINTNGEIRFSVLTKNQAKAALAGDKIYSMAVSDGDIKTEQYDRNVEYNIEDKNNKKGKDMYDYAVYLYANPGEYDILFRQCDDVAVEILRKGGINIESKFLPNKTYNEAQGII